MKKLNILTILLVFVLLSACSKEEENPVAHAVGHYSYNGTGYALYQGQSYEEFDMDGGITIEESPYNPSELVLYMDGDKIPCYAVQPTGSGLQFKVKETTIRADDGTTFRIKGNNMFSQGGLRYDGIYVNHSKILTLGLMLLHNDADMTDYSIELRVEAVKQ